MMKHKPTWAALAAVMTFASAGAAEAQLRPADNGPVMVVPNIGNILAPKVSCGIYVDVHITLQNKGANTLPSGTVVEWSLSTGQFGQFVLPVALVPNDAILIENALAAPVRGRVSCTASVIAQVGQ